MTLDHPLTRQSETCPICMGEKDKGLVACWSCYRRKGLKYGNPTCEMLIDVYEQSLAI